MHSPVTSRPSRRAASISSREEVVSKGDGGTDEDDEVSADSRDETADIEEFIIRKVWGCVPGPYSRMDEEDALEQEKAELNRMLKKLSTVGFLQFPGMLIFFFIAISGQQVLAWSLLTVKLVAVYWWQRGQLMVLQDLLRVNKSERGQYLHAVCTNFITKGWQPLGDGRSSLTIGALKHWRTVLMLSLYQVIDPDLDALTAGNAESLINKEQGERFAESWRHAVPFIPGLGEGERFAESWRHAVPFIPGFGEAVAWIGLPNLLQLFMLFAACIQMWTLIHMVRMCRESIASLTHDKTRYFVFADFAHIADLSNMMLINSVFLVLRQAQLRKRDINTGRPKDRIHGFMAKIVCGTVPAAWLQVSLLALAKPSFDHPLAVVSTILSVMTSLYAMFKALLLAIPHLVYQLRVMDKGCHAMLVRNALCVPLTVLMLLACTIRLVGVFMCPSSMLKLTSGCVPLDN